MNRPTQRAGFCVGRFLPVHAATVAAYRAFRTPQMHLPKFTAKWREFVLKVNRLTSEPAWVVLVQSFVCL